MNASRATWRNPEFLKLLSAVAVSDMGSQVTALALPLTAILALHATPIQVGLLGASEFLPYLVVGLPAGVLVDRARPVPLMVASDLGRALILASVPVAALFGVLQMGQLYVVGFCVGCLSVLFGVAQQLSLYRVIDRDQLIDANSKFEVSRAVAQVGGPGMGGILVAAVGGPAAILVDAVSYLVSAPVIALMKVRGTATTESPAREPFLRQLRDGLAFIARQPILRALAACLALGNVFGEVFYVVFLIYVVRELHLSPAVIGGLLAISSTGAVVGALAATWLGKRIGVGLVITLGAPSFGLLLIPLAPAAVAPVAIAVGLFLAGLWGVAYNANQLGLRQSLTPPQLIGRMTATMRFLIVAPVPLSTVLGGFVASWLGLHTALWIAALGGMLTLVPLLLSPVPWIRRIPEAEVAPGPA